MNRKQIISNTGPSKAVDARGSLGREEFPIWTPQKITVERIFNNLDPKDAFKAFRSSSSGFISNPIVRGIILSRDNYKCCECPSVEHLQIDHILSVYHCFHNGLFLYCNTKENLQLLCRKCNASKKP